MAVDFPANPNAGDEFVANGITYRFEGGSWILGFQPSPLVNYVQKSGDIMTGPLQLHGDAVNPLDAVPARMVPQLMLYNAPFPNQEHVDVDITGCKSVQLLWNGAINEGTLASLSMSVQAGGVWHESANTYRLSGWQLSGTTFTSNITGTNFSLLQLSGTPTASDWAPAGAADLLNGNEHGTFRFFTRENFVNAGGMSMRHLVQTANNTIPGLAKTPLTGIRLRWPATQKFVAGGWLQVMGNKG